MIKNNKKNKNKNKSKTEKSERIISRNKEGIRMNEGH